MYTGLDNKKIGNIFGISLSEASKVAMRVGKEEKAKRTKEEGE
jgi:hypothetical protein